VFEGVHLSSEIPGDWCQAPLHCVDLAWDQEALATLANAPATSARAPVSRSFLCALYRPGSI